ncbi:MAG: tRNA (N(6)-L-threonylcarbamoyladenosine(37)-C(2))-methylthiotransferase MtaB [Sphingomonadales bacterium]|nr:tRNA (N(6)-L-threonylcarbamoyladenosine(37)-C(2))-methylthiotransferase MtaB [Sphingomonadales bacterium]
MTLEVVSLGCRLNLTESESLRGLLRGAENLTVVNSCAVTAEAVRQTRQAIRRARKARPEARLLVTGCAAEVERAALAAMPEVDGLVDNAAKLDARVYLLPREGGDLRPDDATVASSRLRPPPSRGSEALHTRAFVAVQTGCDHACTFCVIPQGRGPSRSRPVAEVIADVARHLEAGAREVVLTGVDLTSWGGDLSDHPKLGALVAAILLAFPALERLRLSSLDGIEIDPELFELLAGEPRVMPHVHLSLQSGDDMILKRMKRRHSRADAVQLVERLRARRPEIAVGADLIAGFPTEDAAMHANNLSIIAELDIVHGHVFPYSPRPGTPAARMPQVAPAIVKARAAELRSAVAAQRDAWLTSLIGTPLKVLAERDGTGHAENFARVRVLDGSKVSHWSTITPSAVIEGMLV